LRNRIALKLIKVGMDTREVMARFESERQALALMHHPAIAKVFDAAFSPEGRPYFVMELVAGLPVTDYCDQHRLTMRERLFSSGRCPRRSGVSCAVPANLRGLKIAHQIRGQCYLSCLVQNLRSRTGEARNTNK